MAPVILTRTAWGARHPKVAPASYDQRLRVGFVLHWNGPPVHASTFCDGRCSSMVAGIQNWHMDTQGWSDIAYSFLVCDHGTVFEGRGWQWTQGANGTDEVGPDDGPDRIWNTICWLGGEGQVPSLAVLGSIVWLIREGRALGAGRRVIPHSDIKAKPCPGPDLANLCRLLDGAPIREDDVTKDELKEAIAELFGGHARLAGGVLQIRLNDGNWWDLADVLEFIHREAKAR